MFIQDVRNEENGLIIFLPAKRAKLYKDRTVVIKLIVGSANFSFNYLLQKLEKAFLEKSIDMRKSLLQGGDVSIFMMDDDILHLDREKKKMNVQVKYFDFHEAVNEFVQQDRKERISQKRK